MHDVVPDAVDLAELLEDVLQVFLLPRRSVGRCGQLLNVRGRNLDLDARKDNLRNVRVCFSVVPQRSGHYLFNAGKLVDKAAQRLKVFSLPLCARFCPVEIEEARPPRLGASSGSFDEAIAC